MQMPVYVQFSEQYSGVVYNDEDELTNIMILFNGKETLESYKQYLEEIRNFAIAHEINELALDICNLQHIFRGRTEEIKKLVCDLFGGSNIRLYLRANPVFIPETEEEKQIILKDNHSGPVGGHGGYKRTTRRIVANHETR